MGCIKKHHTVIDGKKYTTSTLPASEGLVVFPKILRLLPKATLKLFFALGGEEGEEEENDELAAALEDPEVVATLLSTLAKQVADTNGLGVVRELLAHTSCSNIQIGETEGEGDMNTHFDDHFAGDYTHLFHVAVWVAKVNFGKL